MRTIIAISLLIACFSASAQTYRWVDPATGRSVISDTPPPRSTREVSKTKDPSSNPDGYSYASRKAAENFPVTLYTAADCLSECKQARDLLNGRGIPYAEQTLKSDAERVALKALVGDLAVPSLKVGRQSLRGFEVTGYNNLLDLAGYPKAAQPGSKPSGSLLPAGKE